MALIICTECRKEYSDRARACPNCGCPTETLAIQNSTHQNETLTVFDTVSKEKVVKHLSFAKELEQTVYTYKNTYNRIEQKIQSLGHYRRIPEPGKIQYDFYFWTIFLLSFLGLLLLCCAIIEGSMKDVLLIFCIIPLILVLHIFWWI